MYRLIKIVRNEPFIDISLSQFMFAEMTTFILFQYICVLLLFMVLNNKKDIGIGKFTTP